jgi:hypothetical protein
MFDLSLPWTVYFFVAYLVTPFWALTGAAVAAALAFRRTRSVGKAALWALLGSQLLPWLVLLLAGGWNERGGATRAVGLAFLVGLAVLASVLVAVNRADVRRRRDRSS